MNRLKGIAARATQMTLPNQTTKPVGASITEVRDKYKNFHKNGPELFVAKVLMLNGPLTSK